MESKTVYNPYTKKNMFIGVNGKLFTERIDAVDDLQAASNRYEEEMNYIAVELYGKRYSELSIGQYEEVYNEYNRAKLI